MSNWGWPQFVYFRLIVLNALKEGTPRGNYNLAEAFLSGIVAYWLLHMGGFWNA